VGESGRAVARRHDRCPAASLDSRAESDRNRLVSSELVEPDAAATWVLAGRMRLIAVCQPEPVVLAALGFIGSLCIVALSRHVAGWMAQALAAARLTDGDEASEQALLWSVRIIGTALTCGFLAGALAFASEC